MKIIDKIKRDLPLCFDGKDYALILDFIGDRKFHEINELIISELKLEMRNNVADRVTERYTYLLDLKDSVDKYDLNDMFEEDEL
jgi:hypothetical protein